MLFIYGEDLSGYTVLAEINLLRGHGHEVFSGNWPHLTHGKQAAVGERSNTTYVSDQCDGW